jgi:hypothetical protein
MKLLDETHIIGTAGFPTMHVFIYDIASRQSFDLGPVNPENDMCYFHDMVVTSPDKNSIRLVLAETDSGLANLYILDISMDTIRKLTTQRELQANLA